MQALDAHMHHYMHRYMPICGLPCYTGHLLHRSRCTIPAYHFITVDVVNLLPAIDHGAVHSHGLIDHAQRRAAVEAILWAMVNCVRLVDAWILHRPGILPCQSKQEVGAYPLVNSMMTHSTESEFAGRMAAIRAHQMCYCASLDTSLETCLAHSWHGPV